MTYEELLQRVGTNLRRRMRKLGLSQTDLSAIAGVAQGTISDTIHGRRNITLQTLFVLADALDMQFTDFFREVKR